MLPSPEDNAAIRALLARLFEAWGRGDGHAYAACFSEDSDYITFSGMHVRGRSENATLHHALFQTVLKGRKLSADIKEIDLLAEGVALLRTASTKGRRSFQTYVLVKRAGEWSIRSFQNTRVRPLANFITRVFQKQPEAPPR